VQERLKAFVPTTEADSLRIRSLQLEAQQALNAFSQLSLTCQAYLAGTQDKASADSALHGFERQIANFLHELGNEAKISASLARVSDIPAIRTVLTDIAMTGRQAALLGEDDIAEDARRLMVDTLVTFSRSFVEQSCWDQVFDDELPLSIQRQNDILGTNIDVTPCAQRRFKVPAQSLTFESCTIRGVGDWRVKWIGQLPMTDGGVGSGRMDDERDRARGKYGVNWGANGAEYRVDGKMELARHDNGPGQQATYTFSGDYYMRLIKGKELISAFEQLSGMKTKPVKGPFSADALVSEKPCRYLD